jgi:hypothetical protein
VFFYFYTRGCGRIERPAFPAPSDLRRRDIKGKTRAQSRGEIARPYLYATGCLKCEVGKLAPPSLRGALATKQSILSLLGAMDCFASLAMTAE